MGRVSAGLSTMRCGAIVWAPWRPWRGRRPPAARRPGRAASRAGISGPDARMTRRRRRVWLNALELTATGGVVLQLKDLLLLGLQQSVFRIRYEVGILCRYLWQVGC